ncbi:MAG: LPS-assembly protein LptD [Ignavibacteria bacterium]|nr:LPS-assembly protein LptD [Ignavibacteria bacterium]
MKVSLIYILNFFLITSVIAQTDSLKTDSLKSSIDTLKQIQSDITAPINYSARDSAVFDVKGKKLFLYNDAELTYQDLKLNSGIIFLDKEDETLEAYGIPDSNNTGKLTQTPIMIQGGDKLEGTKLLYNFTTKQGNISMGFSEADVGYYFGDKIKKITDEVYFIKNGLYTTSTDRADPEYYFLSPKMKVIKNDRVIAQSVFMYIEGVPVFWIPFGVFPNKTGRSSGIIPPTYGDDGTYGTYISRLGYFWAINDYYDLALTGSWFSKGRLDFNGRVRYALKYNFSGSIEGGYSRIRQGEETDVNQSGSDQWALNVNHSQAFSPTSRIDGNLTFASGQTYYNNTSNNLNTLLRQNIVSNFTYSKSWEGTPFILSANYYRDQNLITGSINENIPNLNFSITQTFPFQSEFSISDNKSLAEYFSYSYQGSFLNNRIKSVTLNKAGDADSIVTRNDRTGALHRVNFNLSPQSQFINVSPYFSYNEYWYNKTITKRYDPVTNTVISDDVNGFKSARSFSMGVSFGTKLIGIFTPDVFGVKGIRHTITPNITYNYTPDFSKEFWGYYGTYTDGAGRLVKYSFFENGIFGGPSQGEQQALNFSVGNVFEMKTKATDSTDNKFQLLNLDAGIGYNFAADSLKFSELSTSFRTAIGNLLNISGGATFNLYKFDASANTRINKFLLSDGKLADMTGFNINLSTGYNFVLSSENSQEKKDSTKKNFKDTISDVRYNIPFSGSLNYNYSESRANPTQLFKSSVLSGSLGFNPTEKWKFNVSASYDFANKLISAPYVTAYRDLNSWEMNFNWYPLGTYKGFNLEIKIKAPQLKDIKITKSTNPGGPFGF